MDFVLSAVMLIFLLIGAADSICGNRLGLGGEFTKGLMTSGRLLLCMTGFMVLAPALAQIIGPAVAPVFRSFGADPSAIAGILLANDSGGAVLALKMADSKEAGLFNGLIVGASMGTTVMFHIPLVMSNTSEESRPAALSGLLMGIITIPVGCLVGGLSAKFDFLIVFCNTLPVLLLSVVLAVLLGVFGGRVVPVFSVIGRFLELVSLFGLCCAAVKQMAGIEVIHGMGSVEEVFCVVGGITLFLAGAFPLMAVLQRLLAPVLKTAERVLGTGKEGVSGILVGMVNGIPAVASLNTMDARGRMLTAAFLVSGSCLIGDHAAFTAQMAPQFSGAVLLGKMTGSVAAVAACVLFGDRLLRNR